MTLLDIPDPLWSAEKVAQYFGVDKQTIRRYMEDGLDGKKINNRWKFRQSAVYAYRDKKFAEGTVTK